MDKEKYYKGKENKISADKLKEGKNIILVGYGQSMTPKLKSGQAVLMTPVKENTILEKGDIVFCKVKGHYYCHLISAVNNGTYQISNNHGHVNGWISRNNIFGKMLKKL